jgi:undecaprenyldiphospho-muramoylpentapeptide beta-N-acetylglucosaminyltransferase
VTEPYPSSERSARRFAVVAGGGTGGHVFPALAVATALRERGHPADAVQLVGSRRGQEALLLADEAFPLTLLSGRGIRRRADVRSLATNALAIGGLAWALVRALLMFARWRPRVVVSVGGYASFPAGAAAILMRIPLVLVNVDAVPGLVHRVFGRFAAASAVAFPGTVLPRAVVTGSPVRAELQGLDRSAAGVAQAKASLGLPPERMTLVAVGGSLGAGRINDAVLELAGRWRDRGDLAIYHVTGRRDWSRMAASAPVPADGSGASLLYKSVPYEERMGLVYRATDLFVGRAGAMTVGELCVAGVPAVLVPLPGAPGDHQSENARALVDADAAITLRDVDCDGASLGELAEALLGDPERLGAMALAAHRLGRPDAATRAAELVEGCATPGRAPHV